MAWELSDAIKLGSVFAAISTAFTLQRQKIKVLFKKSDRHQETLFGKDQSGGLISTVQVMKEKLDNLDEKVDETRSDTKWIREHLQNSGKK